MEAPLVPTPAEAEGDSEQNWDADLFFPCSFTPTDPFSFDIKNICDYSTITWHGIKCYFDPTKYPSSDGFCHKAGHFLRLWDDLRGAAMDHGYSLVMRPTKRNKKTIGCSRFRKLPSKGDGDEPALGMPAAAKTKEEPCPFRFTIGFDDIGFFFVGGNGLHGTGIYRCHKNHCKLAKHEFPKRPLAPPLPVNIHTHPSYPNLLTKFEEYVKEIIDDPAELTLLEDWLAENLARVQTLKSSKKKKRKSKAASSNAAASHEAPPVITDNEAFHHCWK
jgi:hypothetical protein